VETVRNAQFGEWLVREEEEEEEEKESEKLKEV